jgi:hypothetical protein
MSTHLKPFKASRQEIWQRLSAAIGANYVPGTFWKGDKVQATHGEWTIQLDTFMVMMGNAPVSFTRLRAPFVNPDQFRFTISRRDVFQDIAKWFGMQDVEVGHADFDRDFIIKGTDEAKLRALFDAQRIRELISAQPRVHLTVKDDEGWFGPEFPPDADELSFVVPGIIKDEERLKQLFELFAETLEQLCRIGSAYGTAPQVKL